MLAQVGHPLPYLGQAMTRFQATERPPCRLFPAAPRPVHCSSSSWLPQPHPCSPPHTHHHPQQKGWIEIYLEMGSCSQLLLLWGQPPELSVTSVLQVTQETEARWTGQGDSGGEGGADCSQVWAKGTLDIEVGRGEAAVQKSEFFHMCIQTVPTVCWAGTHIFLCL